MFWVMFMIMITPTNEYMYSDLGAFSRMDECFEARDDMVQVLGKPIKHNYQIVCIANTHFNLASND